MTKAICAAGATLMLCGFLTGAAAAQNASGQTPPKAEPTAPNDCIAEQADFKLRGKQPIFEIALENKCERRLKCQVFVYITSAKGAAQGSGTLRLAPAAKGAAAKKLWSMPVKMAGGTAQSSRECRVF